jgi:hypothetical protein
MVIDSELINWFGRVAGIGGLSLGVCLFVFRDIIRKEIFPKLTKQHAFQLLRLITILVWSITLAGLGAWAWTESIRLRSAEATDPNAVHEEYTRLFSQSGVPALMALQESKGKVLERSGQFIVDLNREIFPISEKVVSFWKDEWPHKDATPLLNTTLWDRYSGNRNFVYWIDIFLRLRSAPLLACYLSDAVNTGFGPGVDAIDYFKSINQCPEDEWPPNVGFTFVSLKNNTGRPISNVEISYRVVESHPSISDVFQKLMSVGTVAQLINQDAEGLNRYFGGSAKNSLSEEQFLSSHLQPASVVERRKDGSNETRRISTLKPGESVIFLMNVYFPGKTNLPLYFLDDALFLTSIGYDVAGKRVSRPARQPAGEEAARKQLAWGWYSQ